MTSQDEQSLLFASQLKHKPVRVFGGIPRMVSFSMPFGKVENSSLSDFRVVSGDFSVQLDLSNAIFERERESPPIWSIRFPDTKGGISVEELPA